MKDLMSVKDVAKLYWECLANRKNVGLPWDVFKFIPYELQLISPLKRCITYRSPEPGVKLMSTMRVYCDKRAQMLCGVIDFDPVGSLALGYDSALESFTEAMEKYYVSTLTMQYYA